MRNARSKSRGVGITNIVITIWMELVTIFFPLSSLSEASYWKRARGAPSAISFSAHFIQRTDNFRCCQEEKLLFEGIFLPLNQLGDVIIVDKAAFIFRVNFTFWTFSHLKNQKLTKFQWQDINGENYSASQSFYIYIVHKTNLKINLCFR